MIRYRLSILLAGTALLTLPGAASAQSCQAPPGTAAIDQYCEAIPGATGDRGTPGPVGGRGGAGARGGGADSPASGQPGSRMPLSARQALSGAGTAGQGVMALVEAERNAGGGAGVGTPDGSAPGGRAAEARVSEGGAAPPVAAPEGGGAPRAEAPQGGSPLEAVTRAVSESGRSVSPAFLWAMLALGLLVGAAGWVRYRGRMDGPRGAASAGDQ